jgi:protein-tyrosine phosphatase
MESIHNFRDFGGYKTQSGSMVKEGLLFRSGSLDQASDADLDVLKNLGICTICDLRNPIEHSNQPDRLPGDWNGRVIHIPIQAQIQDERKRIAHLLSLLFGKGRDIDFAQVSMKTYQRFVTDFSPGFSQVLELVADEDNLPILIHCTAGKDRTGFACSLIQLVLGVPSELAFQEYLRSNGNLDGFKREMDKRLTFISLLGIKKEKFFPLFEARAAYLEAAFARIEADYGSMENYVRNGLGFTDGANLKALLLENDSSRGNFG